jgi:adenine deaminase
MIVIGSNERDMAIAANNLVKTQGGMIVVKNDRILASMPLQIAGIISTSSFEKVSQNLTELTSTIVDSGCKFKKPHLIPLFLPFLALPEIRILFSGIVDVKNRTLIPPFN